MRKYVFLGIDGSGKTSIIKKVAERLIEKKLNVVVFHLLPRKVKNIPELKPHLKKSRSKTFSFIKIIYFLVRFYIYEFLFFYSNKIILFDRHPIDLLADPVRYRFNLKKSTTKFILKLFPKITKIIFIDTEPKQAFYRKRESNISYLSKINKNYLLLCNHYPILKIKNTSLDDTVKKVLKIINKYNV